MINNFKPLLYFRALLFWIFFILTIVFFGVSIILLFFTPSSFRLKLAHYWAKTNNFVLWLFCGLSYEVTGLENLNRGNAIILSKHQSTWETLSLHAILPPARWIFKRELLKIPVFGWALALTDPISINRGKGRMAINKLIKDGTEKLKQGKWLILFPEGTRTAPGETTKYKMGGALLASKSGYPIIPVAHNAGEYWPKHSFIKWPGKIQLVIGSAIETKGRKVEQINADVEQWIEQTMIEISDKSRWNRDKV